jgi:hypothetical protein
MKMPKPSPKPAPKVGKLPSPMVLGGMAAAGRERDRKEMERLKSAPARQKELLAAIKAAEGK